MIKKTGLFKARAPKDDMEKGLQESHGIIFLEDENGNDWYPIAGQYDFIKWKVMTRGDDLRVVSASKDATALWPHGCIVHEVSAPPEFSPEKVMDWMVEGDILVPYVATTEEVVERATIKRNELLAVVSPMIDALKDMEEMEMASDEELERLKALKGYRIKLMKVDLSKPVWPEEVK